MGFVQDLQLAARSLRRAPGYSVVAVLTLALGVAASTTMFSVVDGVLLRPLAFPDVGRLVDMAESLPPKMALGAVSEPDLADWRQQSKSFSVMGGYSTWPGFSLTEAERPERVPGVRIEADLLTALGARPLIGRLFTAEEDTDGKGKVLVMSEGLWRRRFAAAPDIIGRSVMLNGEPHTVIGVLPAWLQFPPGKDAQLFVPMVFTSAQRSERGSHWMQVAAKLRPGVSIETAQAEMEAIAARLARQYPDSNEKRTVRLNPLQGRLTAGVREPLWILFGAVGLLLAIACANVASLLLARAASRWRETAVRTALGASRWNLARRYLAEGLVVAVSAALVAIPLIAVGLRFLLTFAPKDLPLRDSIGLDGRALAFSLAAAAATGLLFSLAPIWQLDRREIGEFLKGNRSSAGTSSRRLRSLLVVGEMALSLLLLAAAGLLLRSFINLSRVEPGFTTQGVLSADLALPEARYGKDDQIAAFYSRLVSEVSHQPGVVAAGVISLLPAREWGWNSDMQVLGEAAPPISSDNWIETRDVSPGYFKAMGIPVLRGRGLDERDGAKGTPTVVVNEQAVQHFWGDKDPVGTQIKVGGTVAWNVVGVVRSVHNAGPARPPLPEVYFPITQNNNGNMTLVVRTSGEPYAFVSTLRHVVQQQDQSIPLDRVTTLTEVVSGSIGPKRFQTVLLSVFAFLAVSLAAVGLYGLLGYMVVQRRQEIAVRVALGASPSEVRGLVLRDAARLVIPGLIVGFAAAIALRRLLAALLFGIAPLDVPTLTVVGVGLALVALLASLVPAGRALRVDPLTALRED
jgi:putative ABC transport system permease protein